MSNPFHISYLNFLLGTLEPPNLAPYSVAAQDIRERHGDLGVHRRFCLELSTHAPAAALDTLASDILPHLATVPVTKRIGVEVSMLLSEDAVDETVPARVHACHPSNDGSEFFAAQVNELFASALQILLPVDAEVLQVSFAAPYAIGIVELGSPPLAVFARWLF
jgi:hypothetical protein